MILRFRHWRFETTRPLPGYSLAICFAVAAQLARLPLDPPALIPFITYVPFMVLAAAVGGFGPGLLATGICLLEAKYFATAPLGTFGMADPRQWYGLGVLALTGMVASALFHSLRRAQRSYAAAADDAARLTRKLEDGGRMALVCAQDITERKQAEVEVARQRDELARLSELLNLSHDAIITADAQRVIRSWNRGAEEMYGWTAAEAVGQKTHTLLHTSNCHPIGDIDITLANENQWAGELEHSRRDKRRILVESRQVRIPAAEGADVRILEINRDITQRHSEENELRSNTQEMAAALAQKTVLLQEIHHRVKNNLAVTASLLSMKAEESGPEARAALLESQQRVHSIAMVHEHLYDHARLDRINFGDYARGLAHGVYSTFGGREKGIALDLELDSLEMSIERAVPCALILNELLSNAFKYAFDGRPAGRIQVCFRRTEPDVCELAVEDDGVGLPSDALGGEKQSLGLRIVRILTAQLDGSVEQSDRPGTRIVLRFPAGALPKASAATPPSASLPSSTANRPSLRHSKPRSPR